MRERQRPFREEARQKDSNAVKLRLSGYHREKAKCTEQGLDATASTSMREGMGKTVGKLSVSLPSAPAAVDQLWCWWTFFLLQSVQGSLHLPALHHRLRGVLCPVQPVCGTAAQHHHAIISWRIPENSVWSPSISLFLQACQVPSVVFQLHSPSSSSQTPALLALKRDLSCFAVMFPRFYLSCYLDILIWF